jgi:predicted dinucleotide-binding enzyme
VTIGTGENARPSGVPVLPRGTPATTKERDDAAAKKQVFDLVEQLGYEPVDAGGLADSPTFQPGTDVYTDDLWAEDLRARIGK